MIKKTWDKFKKAIKRIIKIIKRPEMVILPGNISFALILSIFPSIMILGYIISMLNISTDALWDLISINFPHDIYDLLVKFLSSDASGGIAFLTFAIGLFFSSNGTKSIIVAADIIYKAEEKSNLKMHIKSLFLVILLMSLFAFTMFVLGFGSAILKTIINYLEGDYNTIYKVFTILKWPLSFFLIYFFVKVLYTIAPTVKIKSMTY